MRKALIESVERIVKEEEDAAIQIHPLFNSTHEGKAVIEEEIDEAAKEFELVKFRYDELWQAIKRNDIKISRACVKDIQRYAVLMACESIQIAAMANKFLESPKCGGYVGQEGQ